MRRIAVHRLLTDDDNAVEMAVIEIADGQVVRWMPLDGEEPMTEWLGGEAQLRRNNKGQLQVFLNNELLC